MPNELPTTLDEAIDLFTKWRANFQNGQTALPFAVMVRVLSVLHHVQDAVHFRESTKMINGWHDAINDPPKEDGCYIAYFSNTREVFPAYYDPDEADDPDGQPWSSGDGYQYDNGVVTHWMPLPQPPKEARRG